VSRVVCEIVLSEGQWDRPPDPERLRRLLKWRFGTRLLDVTFHAPAEDNAVEMEISVYGDDCDRVRDALFETLLRLRPEYESMIEVSPAID